MRRAFLSCALIDYAFMGDNPDAADDRWLERAHDAQGAKGLVGPQLRLPAKPSDYPDKDRLAQRFEPFLQAL